MEVELKAASKAQKEEWRKGFEARMKVEVTSREHMETALRAELKLEKEERTMKLEEQKIETTKTLQEMRYALSQALLRNVSRFYSSLRIIHHLVAYSTGFDSSAHPTCPSSLG